MMKNTQLRFATTMLGLLLIAGSRVASSLEVDTNNVQDNVSSSRQATGHVPDFMMVKDDIITVPVSSILLADHLETARENDQKLTQLDTLTLEEQVDLVESLKRSMVSVDAKIDQVDIDPKLAELQSLTEVGRDYTYKAIQVVEDAVSFLRSSISSTTSASSEGYTRGQHARRLNINTEDELFEGGEEETIEEEDDNDNSSWRGHAGYQQQQNAGNDRQQRRRTKEKFQDDFHHGGETFRRQANSHHTRKLDHFRDAIYNGNIHAAFSHFAIGQPAGVRQQSNKARRLAANQARRLTRSEQCKLLSDCVIGMSLYDMFVYYYSDDIDPQTGKVDENLQKFDEDDIAEKQRESKRIAWRIRKHGAKSDDCNNLLQLFHRTVEHGQIPEWSGASVNQVCLAEGSTTFVQYGQIANALVDRRFVNGYSKVSEENWIKDVDNKLKLVAEQIAVEPLRCAEELFYSGGREDKEEFPFGGCGGKDTDKCPIQKYRFPVELDVATPKSRATKYETIRARVKCDQGYEVKTKEQCIEAGLAVGGVLRGEKLVEGDWDHVPCGCSIEPFDRAIHWDHGKRCKNDDWKFSVVCVEHRNRNDYEINPYGKSCGTSWDIKSKAECEDAGQAVGGWLKNGRLITGRWGNTPCGCYLNMDGSVVWDEKRGECANEGYNFQKLCKRREHHYTALRKRAKCDPGFEMKTKDDCRQAGKIYRAGKMKIGKWDDKPCGCSRYHWNGELHWNYGKKCGNKNWNYDVICTPNPNREKYKRIQFQECGQGELITSKNECEVAGQAVGGFLYDNGQRRVDVSGLDNRPCGCFMHREGKISWGQGENCGTNPDYQYESICYQSKEDEGVDRDKHGKLISNEKSGFITWSYNKSRRKAEACISSALADLHKDCLEDSEGKVDASYYQCRIEKRHEALMDCDRFGAIQTGLELVFGTQTSPGFICGVKDAVVNDNVAMPGSCCLDAPYELEGDNWGQPYECTNECKNPGPYLAGINKEACDAHGGTWCPSESNCAVLQTCVNTLADEARNEKRFAFEQYLVGAPKIEDPNDRHQCGRARGYFGFDELFVNDHQICEDVEQLKFARDFDFLNDFFDQGSDSDAVALEGEIPDAPELELTPPDRSRSNKPEVKGHDAWAATVYSLRVTKDTMQFIVARLGELKCPCDPLCISENVCNAVQGLIIGIFSIILQISIQIFQVTDHLFGLLSSKVAVVKAQEDAAVVYDNMQLMADYLVDMRTEIRHHRDLKEEESSETYAAMKDYLATAIDAAVNDTVVAAVNSVVNDTLAAAINAAAFQVKLEILQGFKSVFALTTLNGARVDAEFSFSALSEGEEVPVDFNVRELELGKSIIAFGAVVGATQFLIMKASPVDGDQEVNDVIRF